MDPRLIQKRKLRKEKYRLDRIRRLQKIFVFISLILGLALVLNFFVVGIVQVQGDSMLPSLSHGQKIIFQKFALNEQNLERADVILFRDDRDRDYIKRLVGLPGEYIQILNGKVYVNGEYDQQTSAYGYTHTYSKNQWLLSDDEYFVLGDNRQVDNSIDSRFFGVIKEEKIYGKMLLIER